MKRVKPDALEARPNPAVVLPTLADEAEAHIATLAADDSLPAVHPGEILLEDFLRPLGIGTTVAATRMRLPRTRIERIVRGEVGVTADTALRLEAFLGVPARLWLNLQDLYDLEVRRGARDAHVEDIRQWTPESVGAVLDA